MSAQIGYIDSNGHPRMTIRVRGTHLTEVAEPDALVDTGFTGFLMLPIAQALPLGLALYGTGDYNLADGSLVSCFLAEGTIEILPLSHFPEGAPTHPVPVMKSEAVKGVIVIGGDSALIGMEFLRGLKKWLLVGRTVALVDGEHIPILPLP
jgi:predicted aspartyl protease